MASYTKLVFLRCMAIIYTIAFYSLYTQIPGLYGSNGVLPAHLNLKCSGDRRACMSDRPTLLWLAELLHLNVELMMEVLSVAGVILGILGCVSTRLCHVGLFAALWVLYLSLYQVGQTFLWFQWDILLLEAGFLAIIISPFNSRSRKHGSYWVSVDGRRHGSYWDSIDMWLIKWLLFRLMFASGVVKLTSLCPTWWTLTALNYHFESQCIPTPVAWYLHQLPEWFLKLMVAGVYVIEIPIPFLFFSPVRSVRLFAFNSQMFLQLCIILSGNYNFFNLLTMTLCISLLDDEYFANKTKVMRSGRKLLVALEWVLSWLFQAVVYISLIYGSIVYFNLSIGKGGVIESSIGFSKSDFESEFLRRAVPFGITIGLLSLLFTSAKGVVQSAKYSKGFFTKFINTIITLLHIIAALSLFGISLVPFTVLDTASNRSVWPIFKTWHYQTNNLQIANSYGLFRRMTGVGGRPEVVVAGAMSEDGPWKEIHFLYKAGNVSSRLPIVAPHQPRLDWQMWFAALGSYEQNPWFVGLVYRLLNNQKEVLELLDYKKYPFKTKPPAFIKAVSFKYEYTNNGSKWWNRKKTGEYLPSLNKEHPGLVEYVDKMGLRKRDQRYVHPRWISILNSIRFILNSDAARPEYFIWILLATVLYYIITFRG